YYIADCFPEHQNNLANRDEPKSLNEIDDRFLDIIWRRKRPRLSRVRKEALERCACSCSATCRLLLALLSSQQLSLNSIVACHLTIGKCQPEMHRNRSRLVCG